MIKPKLIFCEIIRPELEAAADADINGECLQGQLHLKPEVLREELQKRIIGAEDNSTIVLGYGLCGMATAGLKSEHTTLVMPRVDDCVQLLLGSREKYDALRKEEPGTYFLTKGIIDKQADPLAQFERQLAKYGPEKCLKLMKRGLEGYKRFVYIDTGVGENDQYWNYCQKAAELFDMSSLRVSGSLTILKKLISCEWDEDFVIVNEGQLITQDLFGYTG